MPIVAIGHHYLNDDNQNEHYEELEKRLVDTYVANSNATLKGKLFDSYIKAYRWASDKIGNCGVIGFVTNAGWLEAASADGMRKCFADEFSAIYIYHLKGNARTSGEQRQKEKDNVFGQGSRAPIAIVILVKNPESKEKGKIYFDCVDDYLTRSEKLEQLLNLKSVLNANLKEIILDKHNDWLNQRDNSYDKFIRLDGKKTEEVSIFKNFSLGVVTSRDMWTYQSNKNILQRNVENMINFYNQQVELYQKEKKEIDYDKKNMGWDRPQKRDVLNGKFAESFKDENIYLSMYRPFFKQHLYFDRYWNNCVYQMPQLFPLKSSKNIVIAVSGKGAQNFSCLLSNYIPCLDYIDKTQCFPRYLYLDGQRYDGITENAIQHFKIAYKDNMESIDSDAIFYYIYGILHSFEYRNKYANNLVKALPRIPRVATYTDFKAFEDAGRKLADLHINYESVPKYNGCTIEGLDSNGTAPSFKVAQMKWAKIPGKTGNAAKDKTTLIYNAYLTIKNIPLEAQEYIVNKKSALDWLVERACVKVDKDTGIVNDFNDYADEIHNERYIFELVLRLITVSLETMKIVKSLPKLEIHPLDREEE